MKKFLQSVVVFCVLSVWCWAAEIPIFEPAQRDQLKRNDCTTELANQGVMIHASGAKYAWPGVELSGEWDLSGFETVCVEVENTSDVPVQISCRIDNEKVRQGEIK